ncbi:MAG TPA: hypothetical protein VEZ16_10835 [Microvirga sp.]|nr:hypothetical protein [Microvirga sp.]
MTLAAAIRQWAKGRAQAREFETLGKAEREALARDIGLSEEILAGLVASGPGAGAELPRLMEALSLDPDEIGRRYAAVMRDMSVVCSDCAAVSRCRSDRARGRAQAAFTGYCPNADTLQDLKGQRSSHR